MQAWQGHSQIHPNQTRPVPYPKQQHTLSGVHGMLTNSTTPVHNRADLLLSTSSDLDHGFSEASRFITHNAPGNSVSGEPAVTLVPSFSPAGDFGHQVFRQDQAKPQLDIAKQMSNIPKSPVKSNSASPTPNPSTGNETDEKKWISFKISSLRSENEKLNRDKGTRLDKIDLISQQLDNVTNEENTLDEDKKREIREATKQIEEQYQDRHEFIKAQQHNLNEERSAESGGLIQTDLRLRKRTAALEHFTALFRLYEEE